MKSIEYQGGQFDSSLVVAKPIDYAGALEKEQDRLSRQVADISEFNRRQAANFQNQIAKIKGQDLIALGEFSQTFAKQLSNLNETLEANREADELFDALFGGGVSEAEAKQDDQLQSAASEVARTNADTANRVEASTGEPSIAQQAYTMDGGLAQTYLQGRVTLTQAQTLYPSHMARWMSSNQQITVGGRTMTVAEAASSGDPGLVMAAMTAGRQNFLSTYGLGGLSRRQVVKQLGQTILNADSQIANAAITAGVEAQREGARSEVAAVAYGAAQADSSDLQSLFTTTSELMHTRPTGYTRAEANEAALDAIIQGLVDKGDVDGLRVLLGVQKIPGQKGTELGNQYGEKINKGIQDAARNRNNLDKIKREEIERKLYADLAKIPTAAGKAERVELAARELEGLGLWKEARELRGEVDELKVEGANTYTAAQLQQAISQGEITDARTIDQYVLRGQITAEQGQELKGQLASAYDFDKPEDKLGADVAKSSGNRIKQNLLAALGLRTDPTGQILSLPGEGKMPAGDAAMIVAQAQRDINAEVNKWLRDNPNLTEEQKMIGLNNLVNQWYVRNVETEGGKYYIEPGLRGGKTGDDAPTADALVGRLQGLLQKPATFSVPNTTSGVFNTPGVDNPRDYGQPRTLGFVPGKGLNAVDRQEFNSVRGDVVFNPVDTRDMIDRYNKDGIIDGDLAMAADQLGMTPLSLLRHQAIANGLNVQIKLPSKPAQSVSDAPLTAVDGANALMALGVPTKGAAWLSGNIQQESTWQANRQPWDDVGAPAGGLVSWRAGRLDRAEAAFGQVEQASTQDQLKYMLQEMRTNYPEAYKIFMNPYATDRQLMRASSLYWGYGDEGERFSYARQVEQQLQRVPKDKRAETVSLMNMPAKQRTVAVGKKIIDMFGLKPWQHPNFDADKGFVAEGGARNWERPYNSYHNHNQALDIPLHPYGGQKLDELYAYLQANRKQLGITELLWRCKNHNDHLHVAFG